MPNDNPVMCLNNARSLILRIFKQNITPAETSIIQTLESMRKRLFTIESEFIHKGDSTEKTTVLVLVTLMSEACQEFVKSLNKLSKDLQVSEYLNELSNSFNAIESIFEDSRVKEIDSFDEFVDSSVQKYPNLFQKIKQYRPHFPFDLGVLTPRLKEVILTFTKTKGKVLIEDLTEVFSLTSGTLKKIVKELLSTYKDLLLITKDNSFVVSCDFASEKINEYITRKKTLNSEEISKSLNLSLDNIIRLVKKLDIAKLDEVIKKLTPMNEQ